MRRHGVLELLVVFPDGSKALMSAAWTDVWATESALAAATLGSLADLLYDVEMLRSLREPGGRLVAHDPRQCSRLGIATSGCAQGRH